MNGGIFMRAFGIAIAALVVVAIVAGFTLNLFQETSAYAYRDSATTRFNQQEAVSDYGRQG
jgi:hypothetical protein